MKQEADVIIDAEFEDAGPAPVWQRRSVQQIAIAAIAVGVVFFGGLWFFVDRATSESSANPVLAQAELASSPDLIAPATIPAEADKGAAAPSLPAFAEAEASALREPPSPRLRSN